MVKLEIRSRAEKWCVERSLKNKAASNWQLAISQKKPNPFYYQEHPFDFAQGRLRNAKGPPEVHAN